MRVSSRFYALIGAVSVIGLIIVTADVWAGGRFFRNGAVGGVSINAEGVLSEPTVAATNGLRQFVAERLQDVPEEMDAKVSLRKISLRQLEAALQNSVDNDLGKLPDNVRYLAGIQRIQYVFVYPEQQDVVFAGPGEGWVVNDRGDRKSVV